MTLPNRWPSAVFSKGPLSRNNQERCLLQHSWCFWILAILKTLFGPQLISYPVIRRPILDTFNSFSMVPLTTVCSGALSLSGAVRGAAWILRCWERSRGSYAEASLVLPTRWGIHFRACLEPVTTAPPCSPYAPFFLNILQPQKQWTSTDNCTFNHFQNNCKTRHF